MTVKLYELVGKDPAKPFSPHCWKARMALEHKGVEYETIPVRFTEIGKIENGGQTTVPVLSHGQKLITDSFDIAIHLREIYPDHVGHLFKGKGAVALSRFVESWSNSQLHPWVAKWALVDIYHMLDEEDQLYFRTSREKRFNATLEEIVANRQDRAGQLSQLLTPLRLMLNHQPFLGGDEPIFADYIPFSTLQWLRICSGLSMWEKDDTVRDWFERLLDMYDGMGRSVVEAGN